MKEKLIEILSHSADEVIKTPHLLLEMLNIYSKLYLAGSAPNWCESCQRNYYKELHLTGLLKITEMEAITTRTCVPNFSNMIFVSHPKVGAFHINPEFLTDEKAIYYLQNGVMTEKQFNVLPKGYKNEPESQKETTPEPKQKPDYIKKFEKRTKKR